MRQRLGNTRVQLWLTAALLSPFIQSSELWAQSATNADCRSNPHIARARELYDDLRFDEAQATLQRAIEYSNNCRDDLAEIYKLKAYVDAVKGERERCHRDFEIFLALKPDFVMKEDEAPKIKKCFESAQDVPVSRRTLGLTHEAPKDVMPQTPVSLKVQVNDPLRLVDQVKVYFRREGVKVFTVVSARADDVVSIVIPALQLPPDEQGYKMEYFVRVVDRWDGVLGEEGTPKNPLKFDVAAVDLANVAEKWWFWAAVSAGAVGVGAFVFLLTQPDADKLPLTVSVDPAATGG